MPALRPWLVRLHRWFGLGAALFLAIAGLTGAVIAWDHEIDAWLNPGFYRSAAVAHQRILSGAELADIIMQRHPDLHVRYVSQAAEPGHSNIMFVDPADPARPLGYNQIAVNPYSGDIQARRIWGALQIDRLHLLPFVYRLHYSLHLPEMGGFDTGIWLMGLTGIVWSLDCFIALWLAFPHWRQWRKSLAFRWQSGSYKLVFDLHRSGGVWLWGLLLVLALTSVSMNLNAQVMRPLVNWFSPLTPRIAEQRALPSFPANTAQPLSMGRAVALAQAEAARRGWSLPVGGIFWMTAQQAYGVGFFSPGQDHGQGPFGNSWLYLDALSGEVVGAEIAGQGSTGDLFMQTQFPLHSGRILGTGGRVLVSVLGLAVFGFSLTGFWIWFKKRTGRKFMRRSLNSL